MSVAVAIAAIAGIVLGCMGTLVFVPPGNRTSTTTQDVTAFVRFTVTSVSRENVTETVQGPGSTRSEVSTVTVTSTTTGLVTSTFHDTDLVTTTLSSVTTSTTTATESSTITTTACPSVCL